MAWYSGQLVPLAGLGLGTQIPGLDGAVGALKDGLELLVSFQGAGIHRALPGSGGTKLRFFWLWNIKRKTAVHVHVLADLIPFDHKACPMVAEHRVGGVIHIPVAVVADGVYHRLLVGTGAVAVQGAEEPPLPPGVGGHLQGVVPGPGRRERSR